MSERSSLFVHIYVLMRLAPRQRLPEYSSLLTSIAGLRGLIAPFAGAALAALPWLGASGVLIIATILIVIGAAIVTRGSVPAEPAMPGEASPAPAA